MRYTRVNYCHNFALGDLLPVPFRDESMVGKIKLLGSRNAKNMNAKNVIQMPTPAARTSG